MRIALLTHSMNPRGGVVHVLELGRALWERGHAVTVFAPGEAGRPLFRQSPCQVRILPAPSPVDDLATTVRSRINAMTEGLGQVLARESFDILHAHDGIGGNALLKLESMGRARGHIRTVHHVDTYGDPTVQAWEERSIRLAGCVLGVSETWVAKLSESYGVLALKVSNGVDLRRFRPVPEPSDAHHVQALGVEERGPAVLCVGGLEARKNTTRLLEAFIRLRDTLPSAQLVVAGGASLLNHGAAVQSFHDTARKAGLPIGPGGPIVVTGPVPDDAMAALYRRASVVAMPSLLEGFGLAALEGLACGAPVVVSRTLPFTEHFTSRDVHWADPLNPASIELGLISAIRSGRVERIPDVCQRHTWAHSAQRHEAIYKQFIRIREDHPCLP